MIQVDLNGQVAVVTGATRGIGFGVAKALSKAGAAVACIGTNAEKLNASVEQINADGGKATAFICNVADSDAVKETAAKILEQYGNRVDILVNNAGITRDTLLRVMTDEQWDDVIAVNLRGPFLVTRAFISAMRKKKYGRVINIASISGMIGNRGQANYSASKAGVIGFTRTVAKEVANRNITVNAISPGFIETDMTAVLDPMIVTEMMNRIPVGRFGQPEDIANAVLFFASPEASFVTGQIIAIDGGMIM
ncbi:MAG: 3-oxoacyl-[Thermoguttaceae bacterium]|nr:3-oxoacyl-[acyl-carrier-protein] reductase [Thermoguttaceae bacterium]MBR2586519.1 3-oxoacyl-[acyl-carrier-protein] reductase [Thermoguttaceae bacterium]